LDYVSNPFMFAFMFGCLRLVQGVGAISIQTANYSIMVKSFPDDLNKVAGIIEALSGVGLVSGPVIGSFLYAIGGFALPFYFCGTVFLLASFFVY